LYRAVNKPHQWVPYREIGAVSAEIHTKHKNTLGK
jgi:hypothetical protein